MIHVALDDLIASEKAMIAALDGDDINGLVRAMDDLRSLLGTVAANGIRGADEAYRRQLTEALKLAEAAGGRINYLMDDTRRRIDRFATMAGHSRTEAYGRSGRYA